jgi:hypothetical protein
VVVEGLGFSTTTTTSPWSVSTTYYLVFVCNCHMKLGKAKYDG